MGIGQTLLIYGVVGLVVTAALTVQVGSENLSAAAPKWLMWCLCWPFFAPGLLSGRSEAGQQAFTEPGQGLEVAEARLVESLRALENQVPSALLERHVARVRTLSAGLERLQGRQAEIQRMLSSPEFDGTRATRAPFRASLPAWLPAGSCMQGPACVRWRFHSHTYLARTCPSQSLQPCLGGFRNNNSHVPIWYNIYQLHHCERVHSIAT